MTRVFGTPLVEGWVCERHGKDRRERLFRLTQGGRRQLAEAQPYWERAEERLRKELRDEGWKSMRQMVSRITEAAMAALTPTRSRISEFRQRNAPFRQRQLHSNATRHQGRVNSTQLNSTPRQRPGASHCKRHLLMKMRLAVSFLLLSYYDVSFQSALPIPSTQTVAYRLYVISPKGARRDPELQMPDLLGGASKQQVARFMQRAIQMQRLGGVSIVLLFQVP